MRYFLALLLCGCPKKGPDATQRIVGWHVENAETGFACYYPPDFTVLPEGSRIAARANALDEMKTQWLGKRGDGISFDESRTDDVDTVLLGSPEKIEKVVSDNLAHCLEVAKASTTLEGGDSKAWNAWFTNLPASLTAGECIAHFDVQMFDYLEIGSGWQRDVNLCAGDKVLITASTNDYYRISEKGPWINAAGDPDQPTTTGDWPCNKEGCLAGMFIVRFTTAAGVETVYPAGLEFGFTAPEHGTLSYRVNDATFFDNMYRQKGSLIDKTAIEIAAAE
jgi:hypothetical protein